MRKDVGMKGLFRKNLKNGRKRKGKVEYRGLTLHSNLEELFLDQEITTITTMAEDNSNNNNSPSARSILSGSEIF